MRVWVEFSRNDEGFGGLTPEAVVDDMSWTPETGCSPERRAAYRAEIVERFGAEHGDLDATDDRRFLESLAASGWLVYEGRFRDGTDLG